MNLNAFAAAAPLTACLAVSVILVAFYADITSASWKYGDEEHWPPLCHEGNHQSPIALYEDTAQEKAFNAFIFENYHGEFAAHLKNNGHSTEIRFRVADQPRVKGGGLPDIYVLDHLHFHWSSEHTINGNSFEKVANLTKKPLPTSQDWPEKRIALMQIAADWLKMRFQYRPKQIFHQMLSSATLQVRYPLELHLVHYADGYGNVTEALRHTNGVAVIGVLFELSPDDDEEFNPLITIIDKLHDKVNTAEPFILKLAYYLPRNTAGFYRYEGSLTTPDCTEGVIWTVLTNTLPISKSQVNSFHAVETEDRIVLDNNYRALQDLNGREVYMKTSPIRISAAGRTYVSAMFWICLVAIKFL